MARINSRASGKRGELMVAELLREHGIPARRGQQFSGGGNSPDVVHGLDPVLHIEVKWQNRLLLDDWYDQAVVDGSYRVPVVIHRKKAKGVKLPWLATLSLRDLVMMKGGKDHSTFEHGGDEDIIVRAANYHILIDAVRTDALSFDKRFALATAEYQPPGPFTDNPSVVGLAHCRRPDDSVWMVTIFATDLLRVALRWAGAKFDYPMPAVVADNMEGDLERDIRRFWEGKRDLLAEKMPLFAGHL